MKKLNYTVINVPMPKGIKITSEIKMVIKGNKSKITFNYEKK